MSSACSASAGPSTASAAMAPVLKGGVRPASASSAQASRASTGRAAVPEAPASWRRARRVAALNAVAVYPEQGARAIVAEGPVVFSSAGLGNLVGGRAKVTPGVPLDEASKVLITLMRNPGAQALRPLRRGHARPSRTGFFRVHVPNARAAAVPFAYFVISSDSRGRPARPAAPVCCPLTPPAGR